MVEQTPSNGYCQFVNPPMMKDGYTYRKTNNKWYKYKSSWSRSQESPGKISMVTSFRQLFHIHYNFPFQKRYLLIFFIRSETAQNSQLCICSKLDTLQSKKQYIRNMSIQLGFAESENELCSIFCMEIPTHAIVHGPKHY